MSKTPVSTLQEYAAKRNLGFPEYTLVTQDSSAHVTSFTYKVTFRSLTTSACGTAPRKQDAKHNAARELLKLLGTFNTIIPSNRNVAQKMDSYYLPGEVTHENIFVNSVGKLNEFCEEKRLKLPEYQLVDQFGKPHEMNFVMVCKIGNLIAKATANTKKQAKHDAAQAMHEKLVRCENVTGNHVNLKTTIDDINDSISKMEFLDLKIEQPSISMIESAARAKELFSKLQRFNGVPKVTSNINVNDFHRAFINSVDSKVRQSVCKLLSLGSTMSKTRMIVEVTNLLGLNYKLNVLTRTNYQVVVTCTLDSRPLITDVGLGTTYAEAEDKAISNTLDSINILLK